MPELPEVETTVRAIRPFENTILKKIIIHNIIKQMKILYLQKEE